MKAQHVDLLFVGGGFENFNWLAEFAVQIPRIVSICMFNRRAIDPMKFVVQPPSFGAICLFTCGAIDPMKFVVQIPIFGAICIFNRRAIDPMKFAVQIPFFIAICIFTCRAIDPMTFVIQIPMFGAVGRDFANWLLVQLLIPPIGSQYEFKLIMNQSRQYFRFFFINIQLKWQIDINNY